jgi:two-component system sensor histidine kinase KdpD
MVADLAPELPLLWVHPALVEQALFNILENAAKFSPVGGTVMARARAAGGELFVEISDSGPGIPEAERTRIFDMFYSVARGDRDARGSGLGLTIVRGMIGAHGGKVTALAGPGGLGTTIRVTLPVTEAPPPPMAEDE